MAVQITHIRLAGGGHENITDYRWRSLGDGEVNNSTKATMVDWIDNKDGTAYMGSGADRADVGTVHPTGGAAYLRTYADGVWTNNLLALPQF
ncbi:hypothetical protein ASD11_14200 [Aeromicrobium sp. Root495]|uniref:DUF3892 domain-containing protein n=1 Tax=Aeromicrobium sp. Root495 TaxID=1736550 RepID=UPI0006F79F7C|nr:DUF3892 domain-containing protein [Aeromicrobium sp. Root495]KQY55663.1 hypothetical protein ASD11_14200 [Aeromicrobium sp. Root495]